MISSSSFANEKSNKPSAATPSTEDTFAIDAGRDLFFSGMDPETAIGILKEPLGSLAASDDRFIAAERLKFFPSNDTTQALIKFVDSFDTENLDQDCLEDRVSRRKAVESLGRHGGEYFPDQVLELLQKTLNDPDPYMAEVSVWALGQLKLSTASYSHLLAIIAEQTLPREDVNQRVVVQTLLKAKYEPALPAIRQLTDSKNMSLRSAALSAVAVLGKDPDIMKPVIDILQYDNLNIRRAAIEDVTLARYTPALQAVLHCPNSIVLRARAARALLDTRKEAGEWANGELTEDVSIMIDKLIWDHPNDIDLLGIRKETKKARNMEKNVRQLYKNDFISPYVASKTLAEDYRGEKDGLAGAAVLNSYNELKYFDYFAAYHIYKTIGWLRYEPGYKLLLENAENLPPRFFNHQAGAATALAELGNKNAIPVLHKVARESNIWELRYACLIAVERLGDNGVLRRELIDDVDWLLSARAKCSLDFSHLRSEFERS